MRQYKVTVGGETYNITVEELGGNVSVPMAAPVAATSVPQAKPAFPTAQPVSAGGETVTAPMPGTILSVNVASGASVKSGQVLMILEAMKMENEILSPCDGTISSINVAKGVAVETNTVLCIIQKT